MIEAIAAAIVLVVFGLGFINGAKRMEERASKGGARAALETVRAAIPHGPVDGVALRKALDDFEAKLQ